MNYEKTIATQISFSQFETNKREKNIKTKLLTDSISVNLLKLWQTADDPNSNNQIFILCNQSNGQHFLLQFFKTLKFNSLNHGVKYVSLKLNKKGSKIKIMNSDYISSQNRIN